ncbi:MAG: hypothetical protein KTR31_38900 [Myxococcales bacterium]|nr:hypothetical protein [Myxococcales bacterium]
MWRSAVEIALVQALLTAAGASLLLGAGFGLAAVPALAALALLFGAWGWAHRVGSARGHLQRQPLRRIGARVGALATVAGAVTYALVAALPDQVDLPWSMVPVVAALLGAGGGMAAAGLTLCGLDMARTTTARASQQSDQY